MTLIPGNYVTDGVVDLLRSNGFGFGAPTYFIWEGDVMYMPLANDKETMRQLKKHVRRYRTYRGRSAASRIFEHYSVCTLEHRT